MSATSNWGVSPETLSGSWGQRGYIGMQVVIAAILQAESAVVSFPRLIHSTMHTGPSERLLRFTN